jgi:hypothetical protein
VETLAGRAGPGQPESNLDQVVVGHRSEPVGPEASGRLGVHDLQAVRVVGQPALHLQQLSDGDPFPAGHQTGQPVLHEVGEAQPPLADQLQDDDGGERLGLATDPEVDVRVDRGAGPAVRRPGRERPAPAAVHHPGQSAGDPGPDDPVKGGLHS